ncbi:MAG: VCBS repeat-containing protein [Bacteroidales bacterium]|nr:VCBS repeat-containing protein [Bacteroidales bacterium]
MKTFIFTLIFVLLFCNLSNAQIFEEVTEVEITGITKGDVAFVDINRDSLLDFVITGGILGFNYYSAAYFNQGSLFEVIDSIVIPVEKSSINIGDYCNNNLSDLILSGYYIVDYVRYDNAEIYKNNSESQLIKQIDINLTPSSYGKIDWLDYDNDSYLDIVQTGLTEGNYVVGKIYKNNKNNVFIEQSSISIDGVVYSTFAWGDYNNDSFIDLFISGYDGYKEKTKLYKNDGHNNFICQNQLNFINVADGSAEMADYNNDGYLDIIITGDYFEQNLSIWTKLYQNNGNETFTEVTETNFVGVTFSDIIWGDFDNDGLIDLIVTGYDIENKNSIIYKNIGNNNFIVVENDELIPIGHSSVACGDFNNDNCLDLLISGSNSDTNTSYISKLYRNNTPIANIRPNVITNLQTEIVGNDVIFSWDEGTDDNQPSPGLNYNIYIYDEDNREHIITGDTVYDNMYVASPQAFPYYHSLNGKRLIPKRGHIQGIREDGRVSYIVKGVFENCKTYYWSVQAIDASFEGGQFAEENVFVFDNISPEINCSDSIVITLEEGQTVYPVVGNEFDPVMYSDNCQIISIINNYNNSESLQGEQIPVDNYTITWTVTDIAGNQSQCSFNLEIKEFVDIIDISQGNITVFPNPTTGKITIYSPLVNGAGEISVDIYDLSGRIVYSTNFTANQLANYQIIELNNFNSGIYFMQFINNQKIIQITKLIIQ